jgi:hypothetical protein
MARSKPCVSLRNLTGLGDGSGICDANEMRRNGPDEANGSHQQFSFVMLCAAGGKLWHGSPGPCSAMGVHSSCARSRQHDARREHAVRR